MVYRDLPLEEAQKRFAAATLTTPAELAVPVGKQKKAKKVVKALVPKST